jgi:hypothetical protein
MEIPQGQLYVIGDTIQAVAAAESKRHFKSEVNTYERSKFVFARIRSAISLALLDQGIAQRTVYQDIDTTDDILAQMVKDGYKIPLSVLKQVDVW